MAMDERNTLKEHGLKITPARVLVLGYLGSLEAPITAEELHERIRDKGADLSTVYRTLNTFVEHGICLKEVGPRKENLYSLSREEVQHLLVCVRCGEKIPLEGCPYHEVHEEIERKSGYHLLDHSTEIYGICPKCLKSEKALPPHHH